MNVGFIAFVSNEWRWQQIEIYSMNRKRVEEKATQKKKRELIEDLI